MVESELWGEEWLVGICVLARSGTAQIEKAWSIEQDHYRNIVAGSC